MYYVYYHYLTKSVNYQIVFQLPQVRIKLRYRIDNYAENVYFFLS